MSINRWVIVSDLFLLPPKYHYLLLSCIPQFHEFNWLNRFVSKEKHKWGEHKSIFEILNRICCSHPVPYAIMSALWGRKATYSTEWEGHTGQSCIYHSWNHVHSIQVNSAWIFVLQLRCFHYTAATPRGTEDKVNNSCISWVKKPLTRESPMPDLCFNLQLWFLRPDSDAVFV